MSHKHIIILILLIFPACTSYESIPSLYPSTITKTIKRFNYCLNNIHDEDIFDTLDIILTGRAHSEYRELKRLVIAMKLTSQAPITSGSQSGTITSQPVTPPSGVSPPSVSTDSSVDAKFFKNELELYIKFAKTLVIEVIDIKISSTKAIVTVMFFDKNLVFEEKRILTLLKEKDLWKIEFIEVVQDKKKK